MMLGVDLVRVQRKLRTDAEERLSALSEVADSAGGIDVFLERISGDWREYQRDVGRYIPRAGKFDHRSAEHSIDELKDGVRCLADHMRVVAEMMVATVRSEERRVGQECVSHCQSRRSPAHEKKNK